MMYCCFVSLFCFVLILFSSEVKSNEICPSSAEHQHSETTNFYTKEQNLVLGEINKAKTTYVPCSFNNCSCYENVIDSDLSVFKNGITKDMVKSVRERGVKYQLINHRLYRDSECLFPARCSGIEYFLNRLRHQLDDFEVIINPRDWPQVSKYHSAKPLPILSFSKSPDYYDIMYPAWSFWEGGPAIKLYPRGLGQWDRHRDSLMAEADKWPWDKKIVKGFFRGSRTSNERDELIRFSRKNPDIVDAAYTKNQAWKSNKDTLGMPPAEEVSLEDHCHYRFLFNFRGVAASFRFRHLFLCRSMVFHVGEEWQEFFYNALKPWFHYVPIKSNASQTEYRSLLEFFMKHEQLAEAIADQGFEFIRDHLKMDDVLCFWKQLLQKYTKLLKYKPVLDKKLIDVTTNIFVIEM